MASNNNTQENFDAPHEWGVIDWSMSPVEDLRLNGVHRNSVANTIQRFRSDEKMLLRGHYVTRNYAQDMMRRALALIRELVQQLGGMENLFKYLRPDFVFFIIRPENQRSREIKLSLQEIILWGEDSEFDFPPLPTTGVLYRIVQDIEGWRQDTLMKSRGKYIRRNELRYIIQRACLLVREILFYAETTDNLLCQLGSEFVLLTIRQKNQEINLQVSEIINVIDKFKVEGDDSHEHATQELLQRKVPRIATKSEFLFPDLTNISVNDPYNIVHIIQQFTHDTLDRFEGTNHLTVNDVRELINMLRTVAYDMVECVGIDALVNYLGIDFVFITLRQTNFTITLKLGELLNILYEESGKERDQYDQTLTVEQLVVAKVTKLRPPSFRREPRPYKKPRRELEPTLSTFRGESVDSQSRELIPTTSRGDPMTGDSDSGSDRDGDLDFQMPDHLARLHDPYGILPMLANWLQIQGTKYKNKPLSPHDIRQLILGAMSLVRNMSRETFGLRRLLNSLGSDFVIVRFTNRNIVKPRDLTLSRIAYLIRAQSEDIIDQLVKDMIPLRSRSKSESQYHFHAYYGPDVPDLDWIQDPCIKHLINHWWRRSLNRWRSNVVVTGSDGILRPLPYINNGEEDLRNMFIEACRFVRDLVKKAENINCLYNTIGAEFILARLGNGRILELQDIVNIVFDTQHTTNIKERNRDDQVDGIQRLVASKLIATST